MWCETILMPSHTGQGWKTTGTTLSFGHRSNLAWQITKGEQTMKGKQSKGVSKLFAEDLKFDLEQTSLIVSHYTRFSPVSLLRIYSTSSITRSQLRSTMRKNHTIPLGTTMKETLDVPEFAMATIWGPQLLILRDHLLKMVRMNLSIPWLLREIWQIPREKKAATPKNS